MAKKEDKDATKRQEIFEQIRTDLMARDYKETDATISIVKANVCAVLIGLIFAVAGIALFLALGHTLQVGILSLAIVLVAFLVSIFIHEVLHGVGWALSCQNGFKSIRLGVMWKYFTPYCHCKEPLGFWQYLLGGLLPCIVLGFIPLVISLITGNPYLLYFALLSIFAAGGDLTIVGILIKHKGALFVDHPTDCGFYAYSKS